ncbi:MAG: hypothetical protein JNM89_09080 [Hyphomicrobiaceae bacterium]|nr:hypothetical protein [Hyphomicrobiaceae bacterium]
MLKTKSAAPRALALLAAAVAALALPAVAEARHKASSAHSGKRVAVTVRHGHKSTKVVHSRRHRTVHVEAPFTKVSRHRGDVVVDAPFAYVDRSGRGVYVRAPFVNLWVPRY